MTKFNPTKQNLDILVQSLRLQDIEYLLEQKLLDCTLDNATRYEYVLTSEGIDSSITTTGAQYLKEKGLTAKNLR